MKTLILTSCLLASAGVLAASSNPVSTALREDTERYAKNLVGAAERLPEDKYGTRPTAQQMTFAELVRHVTMTNNMLCSSIAGQPAPRTQELPAASGKRDLVSALTQSFAYCRSALAFVDDSQLGDEVPFFGGRKVTRAAAILDLTADWGDHYSLMATELRLAGVLPPTAKPAASDAIK